MKFIKFCLIPIFITGAYLFGELLQSPKLPILFSQTEQFATQLTKAVKNLSTPSHKEPAYIEYTYHPQGIAFLIDRDNGDFYFASEINFKEVGTMSVDLNYMLQKNTTIPILVSKSSLSALIQWYLLQKGKKDKDNFSFMKESWIIKEIEDFYLMIPTQWTKQPDNIGLKVDTLKNISWKRATSYKPTKEINNTPFTDILSKIFETQQEFNKANKHTLPSWMIYLLGHGGSASLISGFSIDDFKNLTYFLETKIPTKVLIYNSCYAGGVNKTLAFEDVYKKQFEKDKDTLFQQTFSFPIILLSATEAATTTGDVPYNITKLFEQIAQNKDALPDYYTFLETAGFLVSHEKAASGKRDIYTENMPQIRLPRTEWFSIASLNSIKNNKDYTVVSKVQGQTREKPLIIPETVKTIFIYSPTIPFSITIPQNMSQRIPRIVAMDLMTNLHFAEINAPNLTFEGVCRLFKPLHTSYIYICIDSITFMHEGKNVMLTNCQLTLTTDIENYEKYVFKLEGSDTVKEKNVTFTAKTATQDILESLAPITVEPSIESPLSTFYYVPENIKFNNGVKELKEVLAKRLSK